MNRSTRIFANTVTTPSSLTLFIFDGWKCIAELSGSGVPLRKYTWGLDLAGSIGETTTGNIGALLWLVDAPTNKTHLHLYDKNGNVTGLLDTTTRKRSATYAYDAFGQLITCFGDYAKLNPFTHSTKFTDHTTGLRYYGYRWYNAKDGRWINRDPIGEKGGGNLYGFVGNDGINKWDLFGLAGWENYKLVAKSYIDGVGDVGVIRSNAAWLPSELIAANIRLQAFAAGASFADAFNQFPSNDSKDGQYRLFGELKIQFCCDGDKIMNKDLIADKEGGVESAQFSISGTVEFIPTINAIGDKVEVEWFLSGRPNELAEVGMQLVQFRTSTQIWQKGKVTFSCRGGSLQKKEDFFKGSGYPTRQYWINNASQNKKDKGPLSSLWSESPTMPWFVAE